MARKRRALVNEIGIVYVNIEKIKPAPYNPRTMSEEAKSRLEQSIQHFGTVDPIIVNKRDNVIIGGHQRYDVSRELGLRKIPVVFVDLDEAEAKALNIQLNNPNSQGSFDNVKLVELLDEIKPSLMDISITGFTDCDLKELSEVTEFLPTSIYDQQRLDRKKKVTCPECGYEFTP